jgi:hypothetical protein
LFYESEWAPTGGISTVAPVRNLHELEKVNCLLLSYWERYGIHITLLGVAAGVRSLGVEKGHNAEDSTPNEDAEFSLVRPC